MEKNRRGRPRKDPNALAAWRFVRSARAMAEYHEYRKRGMKHGDAIEAAVDYIWKQCPNLRMSDSELRRSLAIFCPRVGHRVLMFTKSTLSDADLEKHRWIQEQMANLDGKKGLRVPLPRAEDWPQSREVFTISIAERPAYPRHNHKDPGK